jgi:outer membrane lipoprotein-sorting protein
MLQTMKISMIKPAFRLRSRAIGILLSSICLLYPFAMTGFGAQAKDSPEIQKVFRQMELAGKGFRGFTAKISERKYTAILKEFGSTETGEFYLARAKDGSTMMRREISSPGRIILTIKGSELTVYRPAVKEAQVANLGKNKDKAEFLALGIGQPPSELQKSFDISYQGVESVGNAPCSVLVLKPKDAKTAAFYSTIVMWVRPSGIPVQYKLQEPNGDYLLVTFSAEKLNVSIPDSKFDQKLPSGVQPLRLQ